MKKFEEKAYSSKFEKLTELKSYVGKELGLTNWMQMSQKKIDAFAKITDDTQWIHTDPEKSALYSPYKKTVAHGFLVLSFASKFALDVLPPLKKKEISEDEEKKFEKIIQAFTDDHIKKIDTKVAGKEKEIMTI